MPNLLLFHHLKQFHGDEALASGKIILQDKASCFPALVLNPPSNDDTHVIDATAAPGNKTSHLSAIMKGRGKVRTPFAELCSLEISQLEDRFLRLSAIEGDSRLCRK